MSEYIRNPALYMERTKPVQKPTGGSSASTSTAAGPATPVSSSTGGPVSPVTPTPLPPVPLAVPMPMPTPRGPSELNEAVDGLQETGHAIIKRLIHRIDWLRQIFTREGREIATEFFMEVIGTDIEWMADANAFMNGCEEKVAELLAKNPQRFNHFRELQKKGVQWPHSPELRKEIEKAGFIFRPSMSCAVPSISFTLALNCIRRFAVRFPLFCAVLRSRSVMIKRDRCMCDVCGVEVSGWRPWHDPREFHDFSKHTAAFKASLFNNDTQP